MKRLFSILCMLAVLPLAGCATEWALRSEGTEKALQWPFQPQQAKVTYMMSITGLKPSSESRSLMHTIVYGSGGTEDDAFRLPVAVSAGHDGRLAVADIGRKCVHLYTPVQRTYVRLYGGDKEFFASPVGVAFDAELRLYVTDSLTGKVFVFGNDGKFLFSFGETASGPLKRPTGIAYNPKDKLMYVADTLENRIHAFNAEGKDVFSFGKRGEEGGQFNFPTHLFFSGSGDLYVTDTMNFRIEIFDARGGLLGAFGKHGDGSGNFAMPKGVAADKDGIIYVVDGLFDTIQLFDRKGTYLLNVGKRGADHGEFWLPSGLFIDEHGLLYACDTYNGRVQVFRITEGFVNGRG